MLYHFECNVKLVERTRDRWDQHAIRICLCGNKNETLSRTSTFTFGLSQKVNNNAPQPKRFMNFNRFSHTFITFHYGTSSRTPSRVIVEETGSTVQFKQAPSGVKCSW